MPEWMWTFWEWWQSEPLGWKVVYVFGAFSAVYMSAEVLVWLRA